MKTLTKTTSGNEPKYDDGFYRVEFAQQSDCAEFCLLLKSYVSFQYPETEDTYGIYIFNQHLKRKENTYPERIIWKISVLNKNIGYLTTTIKQGGFVKLGPFVLKPSFIAKGHTSFFLKIIIDHFQSIGTKKIYATAPSSNFNAYQLLLSNNFEIEAILKNHYSKHANEVVFGLKLTSDKTKINNFSTPLYLDTTSTAQILDYQKKYCKKIYCNEVFVGYATPKRGGSVRLYFERFDNHHVNWFYENVFIYFNRLKRHKFFTIFNSTNTELIKNLSLLGFFKEGELKDYNGNKNLVYSKMI